MGSKQELMISRQPVLRDAQVLQLAVNQLEDPSEKEVLAKIGLRRLATQSIVGRFFAVDASLAYGKSVEQSDNKRLVYDSGLTFAARAVDVSYDWNYDVPVESVVVDFEEPQPLVREDLLLASRKLKIIDIGIIQAMQEAEASELETVRVPILAIRMCAVEMQQAA